MVNNSGHQEKYQNNIPRLCELRGYEGVESMRIEEHMRQSLHGQRTHFIILSTALTRSKNMTQVKPEGRAEKALKAFKSSFLRVW